MISHEALKMSIKSSTQLIRILHGQEMIYEASIMFDLARKAQRRLPARF